MEIKSIVDYLNTPQVNRGLITRPKNKGLKNTRLAELSYEAWDTHFSKPKSQRQERVPLTFQEVASIFVREASTRQGMHLVTEINNKGKLSKAIMIGLAFAKVSDDSSSTASGLDESAMNRFKHHLSHQIVHNDFIPIYIQNDNDRYQREFEYRRVMDIFIRSHRAHTRFSRFTYPARHDGIEEYPKPPMLVRFIKHVIGNGSYKWSSYPRDVFPGPGVIVEGGLKAKMFPRGALKKILGSDETLRTNPKDNVRRRYRNLTARCESTLANTSFGLFRGMYIICNPLIMQVDGEPFALIIFNDHFNGIQDPNLAKPMAFLIPAENAFSFLQNPAGEMKNGTPCDPTKTLTVYQKQILNINWTSVIAGMHRAIPVSPPPGRFFPNQWFLNYWGNWYQNDLFGHERSHVLQHESRDWDDHMHTTHMDEEYKKQNDDGWWKDGFPLENLSPFLNAHDQIATCAEIGFALLDDLNKAFMYYYYGYNYIEGETNIRLSKPLRLLEQSIRWSLSKKEGNKPILVPMTENGFDRDLVEELGAIDTRHMICYRRGRGSFTLPKELFEEMPDSTKAEARRDWLTKFLVPAFNIRDEDSNWRGGAQLVFLPGDQTGPLVKDILGVDK